MALSGAQLAALAGPHVVIAALLDLYFTSGTLRLAIAPWNITAGADTYTGIGPIAAVGIRNEAIGTGEGVEITASGLDVSIVALALAEPYHGRLLRLRKAILNADTHALIGDPQTAFVGRMVAMPITEDNESAVVTIRAEHYDADLGRATPLRLTDADQQRLYPGDLGCEYVADLTNRRIVWPARELMMK